MIGLDAEKKKGKFIVGVWFGCKGEKKKKFIFKILADSVFLKEKFFWLFLFSKEKKRGSCFLKKKKISFVSVLRKEKKKQRKKKSLQNQTNKWFVGLRKRKS